MLPRIIELVVVAWDWLPGSGAGGQVLLASTAAMELQPIREVL